MIFTEANLMYVHIHTLFIERFAHTFNNKEYASE